MLRVFVSGRVGVYAKRHSKGIAFNFQPPPPIFVAVKRYIYAHARQTFFKVLAERFAIHIRINNLLILARHYWEFPSLDE